MLKHLQQILLALFFLIPLALAAAATYFTSDRCLCLKLAPVKLFFHLGALAVHILANILNSKQLTLLRLVELLHLLILPVGCPAVNLRRLQRGRHLGCRGPKGKARVRREAYR